MEDLPSDKNPAGEVAPSHPYFCFPAKEIGNGKNETSEDKALQAVSDHCAPTSRNIAPLRPVYDDFATAYSSIRSRDPTPKSRTQSPSELGTTLVEDANDFQMKPLNLPRRAHEFNAPAQDLPRIPTPAFLTSPTAFDRPLPADITFEVSPNSSDFSPSPSPTPTPKLILDGTPPLQASTPFFSHFKNVLLPQRAKSIKALKSPSSKWPLNRLEKNASVKNKHGDSSKMHPLARSSGPDDTDTSISIAATPSKSKRSEIHPNGPTARLSVSPLRPTQPPKEFPDFVQSDTGKEEYDAGIVGSKSFKKYPIVGALVSPQLQRVNSYNSMNVQGAIYTPEGSTVENIVRQYAHNLGTYEPDDIGQNEDHKQGTTPDDHIDEHTEDSYRDSCSSFDFDLAVYDSMQQRAQKHRTANLAQSPGQAPDFTLPQVPSNYKHQPFDGHTENVAQSSSYGDTRDLLQIPARSLASFGFRGDDLINIHEEGNDEKPPPPIPSKNPYRPGNYGSFLLPSSAGANSSLNSTPQITSQEPFVNGSPVRSAPGGPRHSLERDISEALRRQSGCSLYSDESYHSLHYGQRDGAFQSSTESNGILEDYGYKDETPRVAPTPTVANRGFYDLNAIPQTWMGSQQLNRIKIPILQCGESDSSPSGSNGSKTQSSMSEALEFLNERYDDGNDWETVAESGIMSRAGTNNPYVRAGGGFQNAGSSIADCSEGGESIGFFHPNDFSSTDRIIQHPGAIGYSFDYRLRNLNDSVFPDMRMPVYKQYTVNGFPTNSSRVPPFQPPPNAFNYETPAVIARDHKNPFKSSPPEAMTTEGSVPKHKKSRHIMVPSAEIFDLTPGTINAFKQPTTEQACLEEWMNNYGSPGPAIRAGERQLSQETQVYPYDGVVNYEDGYYAYDTNGPRRAGSSIADESTAQSFDGILDQIAEIERMVTPVPDAPGENPFSPRKNRDRLPLVKGAPGALYRDIRRNGSIGHDQPNNRRRHRSTSSSIYPTNVMRPLSMLTVFGPEPQPDKHGNSPKDVSSSPNEFVYRSPLAPVKSKSWCKLYTVSQLISFREVHNNPNRRRDHELAPPPKFRLPENEPPMKAEGSWRRLLISPHMWAAKRENSSVNSHLSGRKRKISLNILLLCCLFPPMLVVYGTGYLDNLMVWITKGEISRFGKGHKKAAKRLAWIFFLLTIVGILAAVMLSKFTYVAE